ncbi:hypothetical protein [Bacillus sp. JCM 19034]|uniref:DUF5027 family lipoprotein n=1 Tax=Bacillus sp. JCM 19034 TaxID=1481928 RepID=UPI0007811690|nr:hypothetical protein [Bacillus sp. JCM 19034]
MKRKVIIGFCVIMVALSACSYREFEDSIKTLKENDLEDNIENTVKVSEDVENGDEQIVYSIGDTIVYRTKDMEIEEEVEQYQYTLNQVQVADNIHDLGLQIDDFLRRKMIAENGDIEDNLRIVTIDATVKNLQNTNPSATLQVENFIGSQLDIEDPNGPFFLEAVYFSEHAPFELNNGSDYYYFSLDFGEELDITVGWLVPSEMIENESLYYAIGTTSMELQFFELDFK